MEKLDIESVRWGLVLALLSILMGVYLGIHFGKSEDDIKSYMKAKAVASTHFAGDEAKIENAVADGWKYLKRSHEHFQGLGAISIGLVLVIAGSWLKPLFKTLLSIGVSLGGFTYPLFWYLVAYSVPEVGKYAAKESLALMAQFGAGLFAVSFFCVFLVVLLYAIFRDDLPSFLEPLRE